MQRNRDFMEGAVFITADEHQRIPFV
jgi:hypothetical protein